MHLDFGCFDRGMAKQSLKRPQVTTRQKAYGWRNYAATYAEQLPGESKPVLGCLHLHRRRVKVAI